MQLYLVPHFLPHLAAFYILLIHLIGFTNCSPIPPEDVLRRQFLGPSPGFNPATTSGQLSAPTVFLIAVCFLLGIFLIVGGQRFGHITVAVACGTTLGLIAIVTVMNAFPPPPPLPPLDFNGSGFGNGSNSAPFNSTTGFRPITPFSNIPNILTMVLASVCLLLGICLSAFRFNSGYGLLVGMTLMTTLAGMFFSFFFILARHGFLIRKYFANWIFVGFWVLFSLVLLWRKPKTVMIIAPVTLGVFLLALASDAIANKNKGLMIGLWMLLTHRSQTLYDPSLSTSLISGLSPLAIAALSFLHCRFTPTAHQDQWEWSRSPPRKSKVSFIGSKDITYRRPSTHLFQNVRSLGSLERRPVPFVTENFMPLPETHLIKLPSRPAASHPPASFGRKQSKVDKAKISLPTTYEPRSRFSQDSALTWEL